jgi:hypothetical protein
VVDGPPSSQERLDVAVRASLAWYQEVFRVHRIPTRTEDGLWSAGKTPPRWHSVAKTLRRDVPAARVLRATDPFDSCSVADSYATLDLGGHGFQPLFRATWLFRPAPAGPPPTWPKGWSVVSDAHELDAWNTAHDTNGVLLPALLEHPRFTFLVRHASGQMVAGAVLHRVADAVELSNTWAVGEQAAEIPSMLDCAGMMLPGLAVVGYSPDDTLGNFTEAGFQSLGPQVVWARVPAPLTRPVERSPRSGSGCGTPTQRPGGVGGQR